MAGETSTPANRPDAAARLQRLHELAYPWVGSRYLFREFGPNPTLPYVDLMFAFGLARVGETDIVRRLLEQAMDALRSNDVQQTLFQMFEYRIRQALEGKPHTGPLPTEHLEYVEHSMDRMHRFVVDRMRQCSNILEPDLRIDPYRHWGARPSDLDRALADLVDTHDKQAIVTCIQELLGSLPWGEKENEQRARILQAALNVAPRVGEEFAVDLLNQTLQVYDAPAFWTDPGAWMNRVHLLKPGLTVAAYFGLSTAIHTLIARFKVLLESQRGEWAVRAFEELAGPCFRGLRKLGMRDELDDLLNLMTDLVLEGRDLKDVENKLSPAAWRALLHVAGGWYYFGRDGQADRIVLAVRNILFKEMTGDIKERTLLACGYASTVGQANVEFAQKCLEELFEKLKGIRDTYTTNAYYSTSQLEVVEAVVLAVIGME